MDLFYRAYIQNGDGCAEGGSDSLDNPFVTSHFELVLLLVVLMCLIFLSDCEHFSVLSLFMACAYGSGCALPVLVRSLCVLCSG